MAYAAGKHALAICDRCGFSKKYSKLIKKNGPDLKFVLNAMSQKIHS